MLKHRWQLSLLASSVFFAAPLSAVVSKDAAAQTRPTPDAQSLLELVVGTIRTALSPDQNNSGSTSQARNIRSLPNGKPIPNKLIGNEQFKNSLAVFNAVPRPEGALGDANSPSISSLLTQIASNVEFSQLELSAADEAEVKKANSVLYTNTPLGIKTETYRKYLDYKAQYDDVTKSLRMVTDPAQRATLIAKARQIEREWTLFGSKSDVETALGVITSLKSEDGPRLLRSWQSVIAGEADLSPSGLASIFATSEWSRVSLSSTSLKDIHLTVKGDTETDELPTLQSISFDYTVYRIGRTALQHPFLQDRSWRTTTGFVISGGNPTASSPSELIPRAVSAVLVVKNVELTFTNPISSSVETLLQSASNLAVSGLVFRAEDTGGISFQSRYLSGGSPELVGYLSETLPKMPDPTPGRVWPK